MKRIINGKKYNTETAKHIGHWDNIDGRNIIACNDFHYEESDLYQKKTGEFFFCDSSYRADSRIIPCTEAQAKDFVSLHCSVEKYEEIFGEVEE